MSAHPLKVTTDIHKENLALRRLLSECATFLRVMPLVYANPQEHLGLINKIEKALKP